MAKTKAPITSRLHSSGILFRHVVFAPPKVSIDNKTKQSTIIGQGFKVAELMKTYQGQTLLERSNVFYNDQYIFPDEETHALEYKELRELDRIQLRELYNYKTAQLHQYKQDIANGIERPEVIDTTKQVTTQPHEETEASTKNTAQ